MASREEEFRLKISALDRVTAPMRRIGAQMARLTAPARGVAAATAGIFNAAGGDRVVRQTQQLGRSMGVLRQRIAPVVGSMSAIAGFGATAGLGGSVITFARVGDEAAKMARRLNMNVEAYQELQYWADRNGIASEQFAQGMTALNIRLGQAAAGENDRVASLLRALNIELRDAGGNARSTEDVMADLAVAFERNEDPITRNRMAVALFGEEVGTRMLDALAQGRDGMMDLRAQARRLGIVLSGQAASDAETLTDSLTNIRGALFGMYVTIGSKLGPALQPMIESLADWVATNRDLIGQKVGAMAERFAAAVADTDWAAVVDRIGSIAETIGKVVDAIGGWDRAAIGLIALLNGGLIAAVVSVGVNLVKLGATIVPMVITAIGGLATAGGALAVKAFPMVVAAVKGVGTAVAAIGRMLMANPIGLAVVAIGTAAYLVIKYWRPIAEWFRKLWGDVRQIFDGFVQWIGSLLSGDFQGAADGVRKMWSGLTGFFGTLWDGVKGLFTEFGVWVAGLFGVDQEAARQAIEGVWTAIETFFGDLWDRVKAPFNTFVTWVSDTFGADFEAAGASIQTAWDEVGAFFERWKDRIVGAFEFVKRELQPIIDWIAGKVEFITDLVDGVRSAVDTVTALVSEPTSGTRGRAHVDQTRATDGALSSADAAGAAIGALAAGQAGEALAAQSAAPVVPVEVHNEFNVTGGARVDGQTEIRGPDIRRRTRMGTAGGFTE